MPNIICKDCNRVSDSRSMRNCPRCNAYVCQQCLDENNGVCSACAAEE